jgi:phage gpG-like protein
MIEWKFALENEAEFKRQLERLAELTSDFRIPLNLIANDFYQSQKKIFTLKGPGKYQDLKERTIKEKERLLGKGNAYPILFRTGRLAKSTLDRNSGEAEFYLGKTELIMGTSVPYAIFHNSDELPRNKIPQRKVVFIDGGPLDTAKDGKYGRRDRWATIIFSHIQQLINKEV